MKKFFRLILYILVFLPILFLPFISEIVSVSVENSIYKRSESSKSTGTPIAINNKLFFIASRKYSLLNTSM